MQLVSDFLRAQLLKNVCVTREEVDNFDKENWVEEEFCQGTQKMPDQRVLVQQETSTVSLVGENQVSCENCILLFFFWEGKGRWATTFWELVCKEK